MQKLTKNHEHLLAFTLIELMIVVAIIGIVASIAQVQFRIFQAKAKQGEVKTVLTHLYNIQEAYYAQNSTYNNTDVGYGWYGGTLADCTNPGVLSNGANMGLANTEAGCRNYRYSYWITEKTDSYFVVTASNPNLFPGCDVSDRWTIDQNKVIRNINDAMTRCD